MKIFLFLFSPILLLTFTAPEVNATEGIVPRLIRLYRQYQNTPAKQWDNFIQRQLIYRGAITARDNKEALILERLNNKRKWEELVPVSSRTAYLLRMERNLEPLPEGLSPQDEADLRLLAARLRKQTKKRLIERYERLQSCIHRHPSLKIYALNPQAEIFFSKERFFAPRRTLSAYQTAEQLFCSPGFEKTLHRRQAKTLLDERSFTIRLPSATNPETALEFFFSETSHMVFVRFIKNG